MNRKLRIGMVCPYGWDTPGGVQIHMKELAEHFQREGHIVADMAIMADMGIGHEIAARAHLG